MLSIRFWFSVFLCSLALSPNAFVLVGNSELGSVFAVVTDQKQLKAVDPSRSSPPSAGTPGLRTGGGANFSLTRVARTGVETLWRHVMCHDKDDSWNPIGATTTFEPTDSKATCLMTAHVKQQVYTVWYYRHDSAKAWVYYSTITWNPPSEADYYVYEFIWIAGATPSTFYPWAWKVDIFVDASYQATDYFEITDGGLTKSVMCQSVDSNGNPVGEKSTFYIGTDSRAYHYVRSDKMAYYNEILDRSHTIRCEWYSPSGSLYMASEAYWGDYKNLDPNYDYWGWAYDNLDYLAIGSGTPTGVWTIKTYFDQYYDSGSRWYGPFSTIQFTVTASSPSKGWTVIAYLDGDNNLETYAIAKFLSMAQVGSSTALNLVVQLDRIPGYDTGYGDWTDCKRFYVTKGMTPTSANAVQSLGEQNMGDPNTLSTFVNWAVQNYPANRYLLILFNHGSGIVQIRTTTDWETPLGICWDETDGDVLTTIELGQALSAVTTTMHVTYLDACTMAGLEVAHQIRDKSEVMVASQEVGWARSPDSVYSTFLTSLNSNPSMSTANLGSSIVTAYVQAWSGQSKKITCSATDLTKLRSTGLVTVVDNFALKLIQKYPTYSSQIREARTGTASFEGPYAGNANYYIDLYHFADRIYNLISDTDLRSAATDVKNNVQTTVIASQQDNHPNAHGLSIFFPDLKSKYDTYRTTYRACSFAGVTNWDEWMDTYYVTPPYTTVVTTVSLYATASTTSTSYTTSNVTSFGETTTVMTNTYPSTLYQTTTSTRYSGTVSLTYTTVATFYSTSITTRTTTVTSSGHYTSIVTTVWKTGPTTTTQIFTSTVTSGNTVYVVVNVLRTTIERFLERIISTITSWVKSITQIITSLFITETVRDTVVKIEPLTNERGTSRLELDASPKSGVINKPITISGRMYGSWRCIVNGTVVGKPVTVSTGWGFSTVVTTDNYGQFAVQTTCPSKGGTYSITATFYEDQDLEGSSQTISFQVVEYIETTLSISYMYVQQDMSLATKFYGYLREKDSGTGVAGKTVLLTVLGGGSGWTYTLTTNSAGYYEHIYTNNSGIFTWAEARFNGEGMYLPSYSGRLYPR